MVLVDLDDEYECPPTLLDDWLSGGKHSNLYVRVAVREVESWLLASRGAFSTYLSIAKSEIPINTDDILNPKDFLLSLVKKSRKKTIRTDLVPERGKTAKVGPNYNARLAGFVNQFWDYKEAVNFSESLNKTVECLKKIEKY